LGESSTIGSAHDIENIMNHADDLRAFFHKYYCCANAAICISGSIGDADALLRHIDAKFGHLPPGECTRDNGGDTVKPVLPQRGVRSVDVAGAMPVGSLSFRVADGITREAIALEALAVWFSSGVSGPFQQLLQQDPELHGVQADFCRVRGPSLFTVWIMPVSGGDCTTRVERLQRQLLSLLVRTECMGLDDACLQELKATLGREWQREIQSAAQYTQAIVESFARSNTPFDVTERCRQLQALTLEDVRAAWKDVFQIHRLTIGRVLPELMEVPLAAPVATPYDARGNVPTAIVVPTARPIPFAQATRTASGVYLQDARAPCVSVRVHIPAQDTHNVEAALRAALATTGVRLASGEVLRESQLQHAFDRCGASLSVEGNHAGMNVRLDVPADQDVPRLLGYLRAGFASPTVSAEEFSRKQHYLSEIAIGMDTDVTGTARRMFSECVFHDPADPRRLTDGAATAARLNRVGRGAALQGLQDLASRGAFVTCVAPDAAHLELVRSLFEQGAQARHDDVLGVPGVSPYAGQVVTRAMPNKTSATMITGCACGIGPQSPHALPLSLAVDCLGGGFTSRLMATVREKNGLTYGINSATHLSDPSTSTLYTVGTFAPGLLARGVSLSQEVLRKWREQGITEEELAVAKSRAVGAAKVAWNASSSVADALHANRLHFADPAARCASLPDRVAAVTLADCRAALDALPPFKEWVCVCAGAVPETMMK
jgi:zinc protease